MTTSPSRPIEFNYPPRKRIEELNSEIEKISKIAVGKLDKWVGLISHISACVEAFSELPSTGGHQVLGWLRLASAFRLKAAEKDATGSDALAALEFLNQSRKAWQEPSKLRELNWVLDRALFQMGLLFEGGWIYRAISNAEMHAIQERMIEISDAPEKSVSDAANEVTNQVGTIRALAALAELTGFDQKLDALIDAARSSGASSRTARAALIYFGYVDDVIPDDVGILGLLDDLYVIEWAYATVEEQAYGLPFLDSLLAKFPHLESSYLTANGMMMDRFGQYVVGTAHEALLDKNRQHIVLRDAEAFLAPVVGSLALSAMQENAEAGAEQKWEEGTILNLLNLGQKPERVRYLGHQVVAGAEMILVEVRSSGRIYLPAHLAGSMEVSPRQDYKTLSSGPAVSEWQHNHSIDPLHFLLKERPRSDARRAVLVLAPRNLLEHYLPSLHCRGEPISKIVGATWISAAEHEEPLSHSIIDRAMIYACGSAMVARNLIENPPPDVNGFDLVAFGTQAFKEIEAEFSGQTVAGLRTLCLSDISEYPGAPKEALLLEDNVVLPWSLRPRGFGQTDHLARALRRQYNHWIVDRRVKVIPNQALATISQFLQGKDTDPEEEFSPLVPQLRRFLTDAGMMPRAGGILSDSLKERARILSQGARAEALYDQSLVGVVGALEELSRDANFGPDLFAEIVAEDTKPVTILCRSHQEAQETTTILKKRGLAGAGLTAPELFRTAPVVHLVVPGWYGAETMRRLDTTAPAARVDVFLFDFQEEWFKRVTEGVRRRVRSFNTPLEQPDGGRETNNAERQLAWPRPAKSAPPPNEEPPDFVPPSDRRPDLGRLFQVVHHGATTENEVEVDAIPIILDDFASYMFVPPHANLVLLNSSARRPEEACVAVKQLREADEFVLKDGSHRELFQELAPNYLKNPDAVLEAANIWRKPLIRAYEAGPIVWSKFRQRLVDAGLKRTDLAYRNWITGQTIAPMNYREVIPAICALSDDPSINKAGEASVQAVSALYQARHTAAVHIFEQLLRGTVDRSSGSLRIEVGGTCVDLSVHRVEFVGEPAKCARSMLWQLQALGQKGGARMQ